MTVRYRTHGVVGELLMGCGNLKLSESLRERLKSLGEALDQKQQLRVFNGGLIGFDNETEHEVSRNVTGKEVRSAAQPWPGRRARSRQQRPRRGEWWWPPGTSGSLGAVAQLDWLDGLGSLVSAYPGIRAAIHGDHAWMAVPARPMGVQGPLAIFVVCYPRDTRLKVRGWGFWVNSGWLTPMGNRHTNYPDQSICAFADDGTWTRRSGLTALADRYCEWAIRQMHFESFARWVGMQVGPNALYRIHEFRDGELCHCNSGARYGACCRPVDEALVAGNPDAEFLALINFTRGVPLGEQSTPVVVYRIAHGQFPPGSWIGQVVSADERRAVAAKSNDRRWRFRFRANTSVSLKAVLNSC